MINEFSTMFTIFNAWIKQSCAFNFPILVIYIHLLQICITWRFTYSRALPFCVEYAYWFTAFV